MRCKPSNAIEVIGMHAAASSHFDSSSDRTMSSTTKSITTMTTPTTRRQRASVQQQGCAKYATQRGCGSSSAQLHFPRAAAAKAQTQRMESIYRLTAFFTPRCLLLALLLCFTHGKFLNSEMFKGHLAFRQFEEFRVKWCENIAVQYFHSPLKLFRNNIPLKI